jgi:hypothetical protein
MGAHNTNIETSKSSETTPANKSKTAIATDVLSINEWDVKMTVPSELGTVTYELTGNDSITFSSSLQKTLLNSCVWAAQSSGPWGISRTSKAGTVADEKTKLTQIGNHYYERTYPQQGCEESSVLVTKIDNAYKAMYESIKGI